MEHLTKSLFTYAVFAVIFLSVYQNAMALLCRNCLSSKSWAECEKMGGIVECNTTIVNQNHKDLSSNNPTLPQGNWTDFKCYRLEAIVLNENKTDSGLRGYAQGCTFLNVDFCNGWDSTLNVTCGTCTTDNCDQNLPTAAPAVTTTTAPATTTTTAPAITTTTASPTNSTTTKKPNNGANMLSLSSFSSFIVLLILAAR